MTFKQSGEKLTGQYAGQLGEAPLKGTIKGNGLSFSFDVAVQDSKLHVVYTGTVDKDTHEGHGHVRRARRGHFHRQEESSRRRNWTTLQCKA